MCLIPTRVIREIGLSLPMFIKWDDADFGLRAGEAGFPTVTLPGVAVWHVPWHEKDDTIDWQAYFHRRNRIVAACTAATSARSRTPSITRAAMRRRKPSFARR
jgi:galactofuranosylgalactofuranosylrhamnosyl-N-acetylglucosaminyl-diphospho-decaprenol beta-1,5/1,6-galactofuranosyltransferase